VYHAIVKRRLRDAYRRVGAGDYAAWNTELVTAALDHAAAEGIAVA